MLNSQNQKTIETRTIEHRTIKLPTEQHSV
jgi:hypothetical protein